MSAETQSLYDWLKKHWRQDDPRTVKYLVSWTDRGERLCRPAMLFLALMAVGCGPIGNGNTKPVATIEQAAASSLRLYHERLAAAFETLAQEIEQGGIEDDEDLANRMEELTKAARLGSFEAFRQSWAKQAGADSPWDHKQRADICRETARGFAR